MVGKWKAPMVGNDRRGVWDWLCLGTYRHKMGIRVFPERSRRVSDRGARGQRAGLTGEIT